MFDDEMMDVMRASGLYYDLVSDLGGEEEAEMFLEDCEELLSL